VSFFLDYVERILGVIWRRDVCVYVCVKLVSVNLAAFYAVLFFVGFTFIDNLSFIHHARVNNITCLSHKL